MADLGEVRPASRMNGYSEQAQRPGYLAPVLTRDAERIWPRALPFIERALDYADGCYTAESILSDIQNDMARLWIFGAPIEKATGYPLVVRAAMVTKDIQYPTEKRLLIFAFAAEDWNECAPILSGIEKMAKAMGCKAVAILGREGWRRLLPDYERVAVYIRKRL